MKGVSSYQHDLIPLSCMIESTWGRVAGGRNFVLPSAAALSTIKNVVSTGLQPWAVRLQSNHPLIILQHLRYVGVIQFVVSWFSNFYQLE